MYAFGSAEWARDWIWVWREIALAYSADVICELWRNEWANLFPQYGPAYGRKTYLHIS